MHAYFRIGNFRSLQRVIRVHAAYRSERNYDIVLLHDFLNISTESWEVWLSIDSLKVAKFQKRANRAHAGLNTF